MITNKTVMCCLDKVLYVAESCMHKQVVDESLFYTCDNTNYLLWTTHGVPDTIGLRSSHDPTTE